MQNSAHFKQYDVIFFSSNKCMVTPNFFQAKSLRKKKKKENSPKLPLKKWQFIAHEYSLSDDSLAV